MGKIPIKSRQELEVPAPNFRNYANQEQSDSMSKRLELRERYIRGWYQLNAELLFSTTAEGFIFDDPVEPEPVTREMLTGYMHRWDERVRALGADSQWVLTHQTRQDKDAILTDWEWWEVSGTSLQGAAVVLTSDAGVLLERITYFDRDFSMRDEIQRLNIS
jgi:hypothetical protein